MGGAVPSFRLVCPFITYTGSPLILPFPAVQILLINNNSLCMCYQQAVLSYNEQCMYCFLCHSAFCTGQNSNLLYCRQVFDKNWHKLHFGVYREQVVLYVDCEQTAAERMEVHGPIDVNGNITISKLAGSRSTVPVCNNIHCVFYIRTGRAEDTPSCLLHVQNLRSLDVQCT